MAARRSVQLLPHVLLAVLSFLQSPGRITFDTDLGLALNPGHLMARSAHLWSAENGFGGVGDQTYGFLFPMGPFFWLFEHLGLPVWAVQRLWCAVVLVVAYEGARRLVKRLVTPSAAVAVVAGLAWALSPRMLTVVGPFSSEALPLAVLPWLLLPLVAHARHDVRRAAALSGAAVLALGAVNASATLAVLPVPLLYLLTREWPWRQRLRATAWWGGAVLLATAWWVGPLLLLGTYSPPFTDWVEAATTTTGVVGGLNALRGATDWVAFVPSTGHGFWPAGWALATSTPLVVLTTAVAALGLAGLVSRRVPERRWLLLTALAGFAVLTIGHAGRPGSPLDGAFRSLLDGPLVPFRNIYKFDGVLRLPLLLGFAHLLTRVRAPRVAPLLAGALVLACAAPAFAGELRPGPGFEHVPAWWHQAADAVAHDGHPGRTLVLPEATTGRYRWGRTIGEPLEALAHSPWAVRDQVPLTAAGNTRVVDAVEAVLASGRGSPALAAVLGRSGVGQVLVRNDLDSASADTLPPVRVRAALLASPGMRLVRSFGPQQPAPSRPDGTVDGGMSIDAAPLDLWEVSPELVLGPHLAPLDDAVALTGGPEDLLPLLESGLVSDQPTVLTSQLTGGWTGPRVLADGLQRRERSFGRVHQAMGPVLTKDEPYRQVRAAHDLLPRPGAALTTAAYDGLESVTASSSAAYPDAFGVVLPAFSPAAAIDGSTSTYWRSAPLTRPEGQWLQVVRRGQSDQRTVTVRLVADGFFGPVVRAIRVDTDAGSLTQAVRPVETPQVLRLPPGAWSRLRLTVADVTGSPRFGVVGIREVTLPSPVPTRSLVVPVGLPSDGRAAALSFRAADPVAPCLDLDGTTRCDGSSARPPEEPSAVDRTVVLPDGATYEVTGTALPGARGDTLVPPPPGVRVTVSSSLDDGLLVGGGNLVDGSSDSWVASGVDPSPTVTLTWPQERRLTGLVLTSSAVPASHPVRVHVVAPSGTRDAVLDDAGKGVFAPLLTRTVTLTFPEVQRVGDRSSTSGRVTPLPLGIGEIAPLPGGTAAPSPPDEGAPLVLPCGKGPTVLVDGEAHPTRVVGTVGDVRRSQPLQWSACDHLVLGAGRHRVRVEGTAQLFVRSVAMAPAGRTELLGVVRSLDVRSWKQVDRTVQVGPGPASLLVVPEAQSSGWHARLAGHELRASTVDGWQQAWVVPAGDGGTVTMEFAPDRLYRASLVLGAALALLLLLLCAVVLRRPARAATESDVMTTPRRPGPLPATAGLAVAAVVLGGPVCLGALLVGAALVLARKRTWAALLAAACLPVCGLWVLAGRGGGLRQSASVLQALSLVAVGLLAALLLPRAEPAADRSDEELARLRTWVAARVPRTLPLPSARPAPAAVLRLRHAAVCLLLVVTAFHQSPGLIGNDTKLDLTADPGGFLRRALHLWNPDAFFGAVQNQAYGYLWPMGPFHVLGSGLGLPDWVTQRLWMSLLLVVAYLGVVRLAERLALGTELGRGLGALAYALAPRVLTEIGGNSSEILPMALLPWVLLPLVAATRPRRAAMRSGVAVLCMGAVNATAVLAVLVLPAVWLLPGLRDRAGRRLAAWWVVAVGLATAWWVGPLLLQGRYANDFLDYIETASTTTGTTSVSEVLRGTSHWLAYVQSGGEPWWRAGWTLVTVGGVVLNTAVLAGLCLAGLARRGMPAQRRLLLAAAIGLTVMSAAHAGPLAGPFVDPLRTALDGALAPIRNVHKAAPLLALPLALGLVHLLARRRGELLTGLVLITLVGSAVPAVTGQLVPAGAYQALPTWWEQTGRWLDGHDATGRALVLPARSFGEFVWGRPLDDPLQALTRTPWAVRDAVPLGAVGSTRLLDALTARLDTGRGSAAVTQVLARAGVSYLVVANDLNRRETGTPRPVLVHQALADSPGLERVASFGPAVSAGGATARNQVVDHGLDEAYAAVEVYRVTSGESRVGTFPTADQWLLSGGPESLFQLADRGLLEGRAVQLVGDGSTGRTVLSDALRRREVSFGSVRDNASATLTATAALTRRQAVADRLPVPGVEHLATARYDGGTPSASSSASDAGAQLLAGPQHRPAAAFDGDPSTGWVSGGLGGATGQWLQIDLTTPTDPAGLTLTPLTGDARLGTMRTVRVTTDTGSRLTRLGSGESLLATPPGTTRTIRVTVESLDHDGFGVVAGIAELAVPGVRVAESIVLPHDQRTSADPVVLLDRAPGERAACVRTRTVAGCAPYLERPGEDSASLDRTFSLDGAASMGVSGTVRGVPGAALDALMDSGSGLRATTSSSFVTDPLQRPGALVDGSIATGWVAAPSDAHPIIDVSWLSPTRIDSVTLLQDVNLPASLPTRVAVETPAGTTVVRLPPDGVIALPAVVTDHLEIRVLSQEPRASFEPDGRIAPLPVGLSEVRVGGVENRFVPDVALPCGQGPEVTVDGVPHPTAVDGTRADLAAGRPLALRMCPVGGPLDLAAGEHRVVATQRDGLEVDSLTLGGAVGPPPPGREVLVQRWGAEHRTVEVAPGEEAYLVVHESISSGWRARLDGVPLRAQRIDGWQQAWVLPAGAGGTVRMDFAPGRAYQRELLVGALLVLLLLALALSPARVVERTEHAGDAWPLALVVSAALLLAVGGVTGVAVLVVLLVGRRFLRLPSLAGAAMALAGLLTAYAPWAGPRSPGAFSRPVQLLALVAVAAVGAAVSGPRSPSVASGPGPAAPPDEG